MYNALNKLTDIEVKLVFCYSKSRFYDEVVKTAKQASHYSEFVENGILKHLVVFNKTSNQNMEEYSNDFLIVSKLLKWRISEWKGVQVFYNGIEGDKKRLISPYSCYEDSLASNNIKNYCTEYNNCPFVCKWCKILLSSEISTAKDMFYEIDHNITPYCTIDKDGVFHVDKKYLAQELANDLYLAALCPNFDFNNLKLAIESFPELIDPKESKEWEYSFDYENKVVGVKTKRHSCTSVADGNELCVELDKLFDELEGKYGKK